MTGLACVEQVQPVDRPDERREIITIGDGHACRLHPLERGADVECWGDNTWGQLGPHTDRRVSGEPVALGFNDAVEVVAARHYACARHQTGEVRCWGDGRAGQRRSPEFVDSQPTRVPGIVDASELWALEDRVCAQSPGGISCWGGDGPTPDSLPRRQGPNDHGQHGIGPVISPRPRKIATPGPVVQVAFGPDFALLTWLDPHNQIHLWQSRNLEFGDCGRVDPYSELVYIAKDYIMMVHNGGVECYEFYNVLDPKPYCEAFDGDGLDSRIQPTERSVLASLAAPTGPRLPPSSCLAADRSAHISTLFSSADWLCELADSEFTCADTNPTHAAKQPPFKPGADRRVKAVVEGPGFQCLAIDEQLECYTRSWERSFKVDLEWTVDAQFGFGDGFACVLRTTSGEVECSGDASLGQRGNGTLAKRKPRRCQQQLGDMFECDPPSFQDPGAGPVKLPPSRLLAVGSDHACAVALDGTLWCWGANTVPVFGIHVY